MSYAVLSQLKGSLSIGDDIDNNDDLLQLALDSASEQIDAFCGRTFAAAGTAATTRYYPAYKADQVEVDDMAEAPTAIAYSASRDGVYGESVALSEVALLPINGAADGMPWPYTAIRLLNTTNFPISRGGEPTVAVTAKFAFGYVPNAIVRACIVQAARLHARNFSPYGVAGVGEMGVMRIQAGLDVDVQELLLPYRKIRGTM